MVTFPQTTWTTRTSQNPEINTVSPKGVIFPALVVAPVMLLLLKMRWQAMHWERTRWCIYQVLLLPGNIMIRSCYLQWFLYCHPTLFLFQIMFVSFKRNMTWATSRTRNANFSASLELTPYFSGVRVARSLVFCVYISSTFITR
jgi:hypothetical protein